MNAVEVR